MKLFGSYFIGAICRDGIVIGCDTRGTFLIDNKVVAYFDGVQKIFITNKSVLCICGLIAIGDYFISHYLREFEKEVDQNINHRQTLDFFIEFLEKKLPDHSKDIDALRCTSYGYIGGNPSIYLKRGNLFAENIATVDGDMKSNFGSGKVYTPDFCIRKTCAEIAPLIEQEILDYANRNNKSSEIGGNIALLKIELHNIISWVRNEPPRENWDSCEELMSDINNGNQSITVVDKNSIGQLFSIDKITETDKSNSENQDAAQSFQQSDL